MPVVSTPGNFKVKRICASGFAREANSARCNRNSPTSVILTGGSCTIVATTRPTGLTWPVTVTSRNFDIVQTFYGRTNIGPMNFSLQFYSDSGCVSLVGSSYNGVTYNFSNATSGVAIQALQGSYTVGGDALYARLNTSNWGAGSSVGVIERSYADE